MFQPTPRGGWTVQHSQISRPAISTKLREFMRNSARNYVEIIFNANCFSQAYMAIEHAKDSRSECEYIEYLQYS